MKLSYLSLGAWVTFLMTHIWLSQRTLKEEVITWAEGSDQFNKMTITFWKNEVEHMHAGADHCRGGRKVKIGNKMTKVTKITLLTCA